MNTFTGEKRRFRQPVLATLFYVPSFYGALGWGIWLFFYRFGGVEWYPPTPEAWIVLCSIQIFFIGALLLSLPFYVNLALHRPRQAPLVAPKRLILALAGIGALGLFIYFQHLSDFFGSLRTFVDVLFASSYEIRWSNQETVSVGIQISYPGWVACGLIVYFWRARALSSYWLLLAALLLIGNLTFIDRTRPFWIIFTSSLMLLVAPPLPSFRKLVRVFTGVTAVLSVAYVAIAFWVGKLGDHSVGDTVIEKGLYNFFLVGTSGMAYFSNLMSMDPILEYIPERSLYPFFNLLYILGLSSARPPSQILLEEPIPFLTNVGTFLEPLYSDGGLLFTLGGALVIIALFDLIGLLALRSQGVLLLFFWANLCFANAFAFFVPRYNSTPFWIFGLFALGEYLYIRYWRRAPLRDPSVARPDRFLKDLPSPYRGHSV